MRKCGICGEPGHNARTCSKKKAKTEEPKGSGRACGNCGEYGHNRRTCPQLQKVEEPEPIPEEEEVVVTKPKRKKRGYKCKLCGEKNDHRAENCPYKPVPEGTKLGPTKMECGHSSWWFQGGECVMCTKSLFTRHYNRKENEE